MIKKKRSVVPMIHFQTLTVLIVTFNLSLFGDAAVFDGELSQQPHIAEFVGKFVYDYSNSTASDGQTEFIGSVQVECEIVGGKNLPPGTRVVFMLFSDESERWPFVRRHWEASTCDEKQSASSGHFPLNFGQDGTATSTSQIREHIKTRYWYFTIVSCGKSSFSEIRLRYRVRATNSQQRWPEFSMDRVGLLHAYLIFLVAFMLLGTSTMFLANQRSHFEGFQVNDHPYMQLLEIAIFASAAGCGFELFHYVMFLRDGTGSLRIRFLGIFAAIIANSTLYLIGILASCGWAITKGSFPYRRFFLSGVALLAGLNAWCELKAELSLDESNTTPGFNGTLGALSVIVKLLLFCWFAVQVRISVMEETVEKKRLFFNWFSAGFGLWALNVPVMAVLSVAVDETWRYKVVVSVEMLCRFIGLCALVHVFCGAVSPITSDNTFSTSYEDESMDDECCGTRFSHMPDGDVDRQKYLS